MTNEEKVLIRGTVFLQKVKAPFVVSGMSFRGALEYNEASGKVRCHECGGWFASVGIHCVRHAMTVGEYRSRHGLNRHSPLHGPNAFATQRDQAPPPNFTARASVERANTARLNGRRTRMVAELRNEKGICQAQLLDRIREVSLAVGRTPSCEDLRHAGMHVESLFAAFNVRSLGAVMTLAELEPRPRGAKPYGRSTLIEMLRDFYVRHRRLPRYRDHSRMNLLPKKETFLLYFGSMEEAFREAGLGKVLGEALGDRL